MDVKKCRDQIEVTGAQNISESAIVNNHGTFKWLIMTLVFLKNSSFLKLSLKIANILNLILIFG